MKVLDITDHGSSRGLSLALVIQEALEKCEDPLPDTLLVTKPQLRRLKASRKVTKMYASYDYMITVDHGVMEVRVKE